MTKLPLYAVATALALSATAWSTHVNAQAFYTPIPKSRPLAPYDINHNPSGAQSSSQSNSKDFGAYTPMPPTATGATSPSVAEAPHLRTDPMDPNHEPINP